MDDVRVIAVPADKRVAPAAAIDDIVAGAPEDRIVSSVAKKVVVERRPGEVGGADKHVALGVAAVPLAGREADINSCGAMLVTGAAPAPCLFQPIRAEP